jgi:hypothetical protein
MEKTERQRYSLGAQLRSRHHRVSGFVEMDGVRQMSDPIERIRQILERHHEYGESPHARDMAEDIVEQLQLRRENVNDKTRYVSAWFDDQLTNLEGAE